MASDLMRRLTNEEFSKRARKKHGGMYGYSKVNYVNTCTKVIIICPEHGEFLQTPTKHLSGNRCPQCAVAKSLSTEAFIADAKKVHGNKYDYSQVKYLNSKTNVRITCPLHGVFEQQPKHHKSGSGCPKCANHDASVRMRDDQEKVIQDFKNIHGDRYDYSLVEYVKSHIKVKLICSTHGVFEQQPNIHKKGHGCPMCGAEHLGNIKRKTQAQVIADFRVVHGDKFDYSLVEYKQAHTKVAIICPEHGMFLSTPNNHLRGRGCSACSNTQPTTAERIAEFRLAHGDRYDYSLTEYVDARTPVKIICRKHGVFVQLPGNNGHKGGAGCPLCAYEEAGDFHRLTEDKVIAQFRAVHGDKYDYSLIEYKNSNIPVKIICSEHGVFLQEPSSHKSGAACPKCAREKSLLTQEEVIEQFRAVHGDRYDYSLVDYKEVYTPVKIICPVHGVFEQVPNGHKTGRGCQDCGGSKRLTTEQAIAAFMQVHGDKYDYSQVKYVRSKDKVTIICPTHGPFKMEPANHLQGQVCPSCADWGFNKAEPAILYYLRIKGTSLTKIGITNRSVPERFKRYDLEKIEIIKIWEFEAGQAAWDIEQSILKHYKAFKYTGKPVLSSGNTEVFDRDIFGLIAYDESFSRSTEVMR